MPAVDRGKRREAQRRWYSKRGAESARERLASPEARAERAAAQRAWSAANPRSVRNTRLMRRYGISLEQYEEMLERQGGVCAICEQPETALYRGVVKELAVDHCHTTGEVRGLLCAKCNTVLGQADDDVGVFEAAIAYLKRMA